MKKQYILVLGMMVLAMICTAYLTLSEQRSSPKPNILYILADDMGYGDLSCYGGDFVKTERRNILN